MISEYGPSLTVYLVFLFAHTSEIAFDDIDEEGIITRAWDGLLVNRVLIYCL